MERPPGGVEPREIAHCQCVILAWSEDLELVQTRAGQERGRVDETWLTTQHLLEHAPDSA